jgi:rhodanese-related sulfurtransferase
MATAKKSNRKNQAQKQTKGTPVWAWVTIAAVVVLVIVGAVWISQPKSTSTAPAEITVAEAATKWKADTFLLDVRDPEEWAEFHVAGTTLIPLSELPNRLSELPKDKEIVVICRSGNRSKQGRDILVEAGFTQVSSMAGGLKEWVAAGYPTVTGP